MANKRRKKKQTKAEIIQKEYSHEYTKYLARVRNQQKQAVTRNENWGRHTSLERGNARVKFEGRYFKRVA